MRGDSTDGGAIISLLVEYSRASGGVRQDQGANGARITNQNPVSDGDWHHLALTRDEEGTIELFLDGGSQGQSKVPESRGPITTNMRTLGVEPLWATQHQTSQFGIQTSLEGTIDEFCIFGRRLEHEEIKKLAGR